MKKFKIINEPFDPIKKFRRRKIYNEKTSIVESNITGYKYEIIEIQYKNIVDIKYTPLV